MLGILLFATPLSDAERNAALEDFFAEGNVVLVWKSGEWEVEREEGEYIIVKTKHFEVSSPTNHYDDIFKYLQTHSISSVYIDAILKKATLSLGYHPFSPASSVESVTAVARTYLYNRSRKIGIDFNCTRIPANEMFRLVTIFHEIIHAYIISVTGISTSNSIENLVIPSDHHNYLGKYKITEIISVAKSYNTDKSLGLTDEEVENIAWCGLAVEGVIKDSNFNIIGATYYASFEELEAVKKQRIINYLIANGLHPLSTETSISNAFFTACIA